MKFKLFFFLSLAAISFTLTAEHLPARNNTELQFLPESNSDYIFAVIQEEFGIVGFPLVLAYLIIYRQFTVAGIPFLAGYGSIEILQHATSAFRSQLRV